MPKQLKLGVSASWQCDSSGWGQSSTTVSQGISLYELFILSFTFYIVDHN